MKTKELIEKYGIDNIIAIINIRPSRNILGVYYTSGSDKANPVPCKFVEDRYKVKDNYKFTLKPIEPYGRAYGCRHFYQSDFDQMVSDSYFQVLVNIKTF